MHTTSPAETAVPNSHDDSVEWRLHAGQSDWRRDGEAFARSSMTPHPSWVVLRRSPAAAFVRAEES